MLSDLATLVIAGGNFYTAPSGTAAPTNLGTVPAGPWVNVGHTDLEDVIAFASEGGEATSLGTLQKRTLRTTYTSRVDTLTFNLQQFDLDSLKLYFGTNVAEMSTGSIWSTVPDQPVVATRAFLAIFTDTGKNFGVYAPSAELFRGDDIEIPSDELSGLPIQVKPLNWNTNTWKLALTPMATA